MPLSGAGGSRKQGWRAVGCQAPLVGLGQRSLVFSWLSRGHTGGGGAHCLHKKNLYDLPSLSPEYQSPSGRHWEAGAASSGGNQQLWPHALGEWQTLFPLVPASGLCVSVHPQRVPGSTRIQGCRSS